MRKLLALSALFALLGLTSCNLLGNGDDENKDEQTPSAEIDTPINGDDENKDEPTPEPEPIPEPDM